MALPEKFAPLYEDNTAMRQYVGKIILLKGLPASGKSTWAKSQITPGGKVKRVNKDDLRAMIDNSNHSKPNESFILSVRDFIVEEAVKDGYTIIVDDTNLVPKHEERMRELAKKYNAEFTIKSFLDVPLEECIARDAKRENPVGETVIRDMYTTWCKKPVVNKIEQNSSLPHAIICDLDGTLALLNGRNPYDASMCMNDLVNENVVNIVKRLDLPVVFVSGRDAKYRVPTLFWLDRVFPEIPSKTLFMRPEGDSRKDSIIKQEIFESQIKDKWFIEAVFDDRNQVVEMWRSIGLTCFQVALGDF